MRATDDIAPLIELAEAEYDRLWLDASGAIHRLSAFWTRLYGPNEALAPAHECLAALSETFYDEEGER